MWWSIFITVLLPIPVFCLLLLSLPVPTIFGLDKLWQFLITGFVNKVIFMQIGSGITIWHVLTFSSSILLVIVGFELKLERDKIYYDPMESKMQRWRVERNFWISLYCTTLWLILYQMQKLTKKVTERRANKD